MSVILIQNGHLVDPANGKDGKFDLLIEKGRVSQVAKKIAAPKGAEVIDVKGAVVAPGFIDVHVHLREPGQEYKETIATGSKAAAAGGFTSICCMANTSPVNDNASVTQSILESARKGAKVNVFPIGAVTKNLDGVEMSEIGELKEAGCVALSDDGRTVQNAALYRKAMEYAKGFGLPIISHALCHDLMGKGVMNEGFVATELGLAGIPHEAEDVIISRDIALAALTQCPLHIAHVSTARGVELLREAKKKKWPVTAEVTPHHFTLTDEVCKTYDPNTKMAPPLRPREDIKAIEKGLVDGSIDMIATDHAPHSISDKEVGFEEAPFGIIGLETALPLSLRLLHKGLIDLKRLVELLSVNPSKLMKIERGSLAEGAVADLVVFDPNLKWEYDVSKSFSKSRNSPFHGQSFEGAVLMTFVDGKNIYQR